MSPSGYRNLLMKRVLLFRAAFFFFVLITISTVTGRLACAHIGTDNMPDSVAMMEYRIYLEFKPDDTEVRNKLGMVYYRGKKLAEADREFSRILKQNPGDFDALDGMGLVSAAREDYDTAVRYHRQALAVDAKDMMAYYHLGVALEKKGALKEAAQAYRDSLEYFNEQYPATVDNKKVAEFGEKVRAALDAVVLKLKVES